MGQFVLVKNSPVREPIVALYLSKDLFPVEKGA
jgi:hypothetical protein